MAINPKTQEFHDHLDVCTQCANEIFNLCAVGARLLIEAAAAVEGN